MLADRFGCNLSGSSISGVRLENRPFPVSQDPMNGLEFVLQWDQPGHHGETVIVVIGCQSDGARPACVVVFCMEAPVGDGGIVPAVVVLVDAVEGDQVD